MTETLKKITPTQMEKLFMRKLLGITTAPPATWTLPKDQAAANRKALADQAVDALEGTQHGLGLPQNKWPFGYDPFAD